MLILTANRLLCGRANGTTAATSADASPVRYAPVPTAAQRAWREQFARWVMLHVQSNPLPICTRPRVLIKGKRT